MFRFGPPLNFFSNIQVVWQRTKLMVLTRQRFDHGLSMQVFPEAERSTTTRSRATLESPPEAWCDTLVVLDTTPSKQLLPC